MKKLILLFIASGFAATASAGDVENGNSLHADNCVRCHDTSVYTRDNKRVKTFPKLGSQVRMCKDNLGITWFDDEVEDVTLYLNKNYYHF